MVGLLLHRHPDHVQHSEDVAARAQIHPGPTSTIGSLHSLRSGVIAPRWCTIPLWLATGADSGVHGPTAQHQMSTWSHSAACGALLRVQGIPRIVERATEWPAETKTASCGLSTRLMSRAHHLTEVAKSTTLSFGWAKQGRHCRLS